MPRPRERRSSTGPARERSEYDQKVLDLRRTARVVAGGRRFSFRAVVAVGNRNGKVGLGMGKGPDVSVAVEKAAFQARKNMVVVALSSAHSIPCEVDAKFASARILMKPAPEGRGLMAGGPIRMIAQLAGIKNLTAKIMGRTSNKLNNARATMAALGRAQAMVARAAARSTIMKSDARAIPEDNAPAA